MLSSAQVLPRSGPEREDLRRKGQFWTPDWVAQAMVAYVLQGGGHSIFDPAVGAGAFLRAAKVVARELGRSVALLGSEIDPDALRQGLGHGLDEHDLQRVEIIDFLLRPPHGPFPAIVGNPPYLRHHRLPPELKRRLKEFARLTLGGPLDGRAGLHVYFLIRALTLLSEGGRLAFLVPADTCEGVFAHDLWRWITARYRLEGLVAFTPEATPFPGVDTNAVILLIRNAAPSRRFLWARCTEPGTPELKVWCLSDLKKTELRAINVQPRDLEEGLSTGLSRPPSSLPANGPMLLDFGRVVRGIATGANDFFFLTRREAEILGLPPEFLIPAVGRTRDVPGEEITIELLSKLDASRRPTLLFSPDGRPKELFPAAVREYLDRGEREGIPRRELIRTRRPWYKMETRTPPPFLFAYLGRRNARFIRNHAGVVPLSSFLCFYPASDHPDYIDRLWQVLRHPRTMGNLALVGKSYGEGCIKVEPRALERLPIPAAVLVETGIQQPQLPKQRQCELVFVS